MPSAHIDSFARDNLPPADLQPEFLFELPELQFPPRVNCAAALLDDAVARGSQILGCSCADGAMSA